KRLAQGAIAMSRGELNQSIPVKSGDEVGQLAASFNKMAAAVSEVDRMKSEFVTIASHELRTPIHAMLLGVSGLLEGYAGEINEEVREDLMLVQEGIERLTRIVNSLLDLSRIESRKTEMVMEKTDMREVVERSVQQVSELAQEYGHTILKRLPEHIPLIEADKDRSIQVVVNLLSNAIKYTPNEGTIIVGLEAHEKEVVLSVADNGYGIPDWAHKKVFEKFFQADSITSQRVGGSGLGLAITKGIVEAHGGTITCESPLEEGKMYDLVLGGERKGTAFIVHLPVNGTSDLNE
ncbi:MAG: HAMP domain-containing sensor histidine kinase, partial [Desulfobacteraceae bacterium]